MIGLCYFWARLAIPNGLGSSIWIAKVLCAASTLFSSGNLSGCGKLIPFAMKWQACIDWVLHLWCCSRERFGEMHARLWWEENRARIHEHYLWGPSKNGAGGATALFISLSKLECCFLFIYLFCSVLNLTLGTNGRKDDTGIWPLSFNIMHDMVSCVFMYFHSPLMFPFCDWKQSLEFRRKLGWNVNNICGIY